MTLLTKEKVWALLPTDHILVLCNGANEVDSVYQTAMKAKREMKEKGRFIRISKSGVTESVLIRSSAPQ